MAHRSDIQGLKDPICTSTRSISLLPKSLSCINTATQEIEQPTYKILKEVFAAMGPATLNGMAGPIAVDLLQ